MKEQDIFKYIYQSTFGCEHLAVDYNTVLQGINTELSSLADRLSPQCFIEDLDGSYCRIDLAYVQKRMLSPTTLAKLFCLSAKKEKGTVENLEIKLSTAKDLVQDAESFEKAAAEWKNSGYPAVRHTDTYRKAYSPAYRVISKEFVPLLPLLSKIDTMLKKGRVRLCIEGGSAVGKSTLSELLSTIYECTVFHLDDFFLRPEQRTEDRLSEAGGNIDRERFFEEVLLPLDKGETVSYRPFDCSTRTLLPPVTVAPTKLTVLEGAYSTYPAFRGYYDLSVFLSIGEEERKQRILKRNSPEMAERFFNEWIPMEKKYFDAFDIKDKCDIIIEY